MSNIQFIPALRYTWLTAFYDWLIRYTLPEKEFKNELITRAGFQIGQQVLDFGVGTATLSIMVKKKYPMTNVMGIDVDPKILKIAGRKIKKKNVAINLVSYDGLQIPLKDSSVDKVISSLVFHHMLLDQKKAAFHEIYRVLKINGKLHIADWGKPSNFFMRLLAYPFQLFDGYKNTRDNINGKLPELIEEAGFKDVTIISKYNTVFGTLQLFEATKPMATNINFSLN